MTDTPKERISPDWERIESDYRAGLLSLREIAAKQPVSHVTIAKRAKREGWTRDLAAKIQAKADSLVNKATVNRAVNAETVVTERLLVEASAEAIATLRLAHRTDISRARTMVLDLLSELDTVSKERLTVESLQDLLDKAENPENNEALAKVLDKARDALNKALSLPSRAGTIKALSDALKNMVTLEREAWGLKTESTLELNVKRGTPTVKVSDAEAMGAYLEMLSAQ